MRRRVRKVFGERSLERITSRLPIATRGIALAICSNWDWDLVEAIEAAGLTGSVDTVVSSAWVGARKPHRRMYDAVLERAGLDPTGGTRLRSGSRHDPLLQNSCRLS